MTPRRIFVNFAVLAASVFVFSGCSGAGPHRNLAAGDVPSIVGAPPGFARGSWSEDNVNDPHVITLGLLRHWWSDAAGKRAVRELRSAGLRIGGVKSWSGTTGHGQLNAEVFAVLFRDRAGAQRGLRVLHHEFRRSPPDGTEHVENGAAEGVGDEAWRLRFAGGDEMVGYGFRLANLVVVADMLCVEEAGCSPAGAVENAAREYVDDLEQRGKNAREHPAHSRPMPKAPALVSAVPSHARVQGTIVFDVAAEVPGKYEGKEVSVIEVMRADGSSLRQLTAAGGVASAPAWSPSGKKIAYLSYDRKQGTTLWVMNSDGSEKHALTRVPLSSSEVLGYAAGYEAYVPSWSPDGRRIAFARDSPGACCHRTIWVVNADGSGAHALTYNKSETPDGSPAWSRDGRSIAFKRGAEVWIIRSDGTHPHVLAKGSQDLFAWSPDGKRLALRAHGWGLSVAKADGSAPRQIADGEDLTWSPDGRRIAYTDLDCTLARAHAVESPSSESTREESGR
jgi:Tol biopolymer transport system component